MGPTQKSQVGLDDRVERDLDADLRMVKKQVEDFLSATLEARQLSERDRDYYDHKQWTPEQVADLAERQQAPIVVNRIKPKVDGLIGLLQNRRTDPKAYPRTKKHEKSAEAITDALRYVADANDFQEVESEVAGDFFVEGYGAVLVCVKPDGARKPEIVLERIPWDRYFFDPHSRKRDFSDKSYDGYVLWMDEGKAQEIFAGMGEEMPTSETYGAGETMDDRPSWFDAERKRVRIAHSYWRERGTWMEAVFVGTGFLIPPRPSEYLDEFGRPDNPIEAISAFMDRENNRYGEVRAFISLQDEINHRRSKFLHMNSQRQTAARRGSVEDVDVMKSELAKPNGHVEWTGERADFEILNTNSMSEPQFLLYQDGKAELDAVSFNAQLAGERQSGDISGKAIEKLQNAGTIELNGLFNAFNGFKKRIYRKVWQRIRRYWTEEKWIRVTDEEDNLRWVGLNAPVTTGQWLQETAADESLPPQKRKAANAAFAALTEAQDPRLEEIIEIKNPVPEMEVDIILDLSVDSINVQTEQFELLAKLAASSDEISVVDLIKLSQLRGKDEVIKAIEARQAKAQEAQGVALQKQAEKADADIAQTNSKTLVNQQQAVQKHLESALLVSSPPQHVTSVST